jgi:hypothetical protein
MTTTQQELEGMLKRCASSARACGLDTTGWALHGGSKVNGVQYVLFTNGIPGAVQLGFTKTDAWRSLQSMDTAFYMAASAVRS